MKAPKLMAKTSLMNRIISYVVDNNYRTVYLDLSSVQRKILTNLDQFLHWFCYMSARQGKRISNPMVFNFAKN
ncbi:AAA-like domain-containing protein [Mastigocoleus testarum]|uniref:AAA-like domain-containing protein n=1 Tax=Mastigocoleus testarum TaxID=996925 RepID=UPI0022853E6C|nr:AAA-like domain-containing protein [Mastigocoleus testarum]